LGLEYVAYMTRDVEEGWGFFNNNATIKNIIGVQGYFKIAIS
jgi:hypothetical protein